MIPNQKKVRLVNDETSTRNYDSGKRIYLTIAKVAQYRLVDDNRREKEEAKKEISKKTATRNLRLQQKWCEDFHKFQDSMNSILLSPTEESMFRNLVNVSSIIIKDASGHIGGNQGEIPNQIRKTVDREKINLLLENMSR